MADLDDFFAKKDKKKSKGKKFLTAEELAKKLEDTSKRSAEPPKPKKERPASSVGSGGGGGGEGDESSNSDQRQDDEWKEFEEEERKDYSGLKISQLTISEEEQNNSGQDGEGPHDGISDGEGNIVGSSERRQPGPWKKVVPAEEVTQIPVEPVSEKPSSKYISPAFRNQPTQRPLKSRNRDAPDITNEEYFPTLGAARPEEQRKKKNEPAFEEVRHGGRVTRIQEVQSAPVSVGNRFKTLDEDDS